MTIERIDAALEDNQGDNWRNNLTASIGSDCDRAMWFSYRNASVIKFSAKTLRTFAIGHVLEDLIVEILSPGSSKLELKHKYELYESRGVREYWIIHPEHQNLLIYTWVNGSYIPSYLFTTGDVIESEVVKGFNLDLEEFFSDIQ